LSISKKEKIHDLGGLCESLSDADKRGLDESGLGLSYICLAGDGLRAQMAEISPLRRPGIA
jgi:hypothetical protein